MKQYFLFLLLPFSLTSMSQQAIDVQHYHFEIELSDQSDAITGKALISVRFLQDASQLRFDLASIDNDKGMFAFGVKDGNEELKTAHTSDILTIILNRPAKKGEEHTIEINYMGTPKDGLIISKNKYGDRTFFADNWPDR